jgi:hypothetical protein
MKNRVVEDINSQWGDSGTTAWGATDATPAWQNNDSFSAPAQPVDNTPVEGKFLVDFNVIECNPSNHPIVIPSVNFCSFFLSH